MLDRLGPAIDDLHFATGCPVTARRPWLETWVGCYRHFRPLLVAIESPHRRLEAAALLGHRRRLGITEVVAVGHGPSDQVRLPARDAESARRLAAAILSALGELRGPWRLVIQHLPAGDPVALAAAGTWGSVLVAPGDVSPALRFGPDRSIRAHVSRNHHQQVRRMLNRMGRESLVPVVEHLEDGEAVAAVMPEVERVFRRRDADLGRPCDLDDEHAGPFFRQVVERHAARGEVRLTTLRLRGELAAYVLCFLDGEVARMWNCRFEPEWSHLGPGRVANHAALEQALADHHCREFDWMRGEETYKASMSNHAEQAWDLDAWSSPAVRAGTRAAHVLRAVRRRGWAALRSPGRRSGEPG